jgi:death-on-curing protein
VKWIWIDPRIIVAIHAEQLAEHGGAPGVRDLGLLESALARPRQIASYRKSTDASALAAAYAFGIAKNHPFVDGNKRTAYVALRLFLILNGHDLDAPESERVMTLEALAGGQLTEKALAQWVRRHLVKPTRA